ncbi:MAG: hypothetical protein PHF35_01705 [Candidatus Moranbacteria bacterium]|nr:hypothetical protein [Candidatus Moranbacteria bacterium]
MEKLGDKILDKIKKEKIEPRPKWQFLLRDCSVWLFFLVSLVVGAVAFCVSLYIFLNNDWDLYQYLHTTLVGHVLISIPYVWIAILVAFVLIANYNFKYTRNGYRHETFLVVGLSVAGSLLFGAFLHSMGMGERIENAVSDGLPFYEKMVCCGNRKDIWDHPENGLLGGEITDVFDPENFEVKDFQGAFWSVRETDDTIEYAPLQMIVGEEVKIIGEKEGPDIFWAREIRPWKDRGEKRKTIDRIVPFMPPMLNN